MRRSAARGGANARWRRWPSTSLDRPDVLGACDNPHVSQSVPEVVRRAIVEACRHAFYYKDDVKALFLASGTPEYLWERHAGEDVSKAKTSRMVLSELAAMGEAGSKIQVRIADELCQMDRPDSNAADPKAGLTALDALRRDLQRARLRSDPDKDAAERRRALASIHR